ncbi:MAG: sensor histidine kinase [Promethearchaeota archaeon]|jgi:PAS domain S-box-containing protein
MVNLGIDVRLSKELFLEISNEINDLIFILDSGFNIEFVNEDVHLKLLGYSKEDLLYKKIRNFIDVKDFRKIKENIKTIDHNGVNSFDIQIFHKDGKKLWFEGKNKLFNSENGKKRILLILKDVSERKQTELIVKESREKYQSIIKTINEGYYEVDLKGNFTFVSDALCKFIGYTQDELLGQNYEIVTDKKAGKLVYKTFNKVFRSEIQKKLFQFPVIKKNGEKAFFETSVYLKNERNGKKLGFYGIVRDITERKKEEDLEEKFKIELAQTVRLRTKELRESEEKYSNLFRHSNDGIFLHDLDGNIIDANQKVLEQFGYDKNEILTLKVPQLHPVSDLVESKKAFNKISKDGFVRFEINFKKKNGEIFPAEVSSSLFTIGEEKFIQGVVRDITSRKESESKLKESERKYRDMVNNLDLGFYQVDWQGNILDYNPAFSLILGFDPSENIINIQAKQFWQNPTERDKYLKLLKKKGFIKNYIVHSKNRKGQKIVLQLNSHLIENEEGEPVKIQGLLSDITEKFGLEQKVKESESRYRNLIESVPFSIALIDQKGIVIYCNPATETLLGYSEEELIGNEFRKLPAINPKYLPTMLERFKKVIIGDLLPPFDVELYKKDGSLIWISYQTSLVKLGEDYLIQAVLNNITDRKTAALLIQEEIVKLKELDQIRKDLVSRVSHELKTPLVSVCGASELLLELFKDETKTDTIELIEMIEKGGTRLKHLVDNLLDITRIEYDKFQLEKDQFNLSEILTDCAKEMMYLVTRRKIEFILDIPDKLEASVDKIRIEQVILNLLSNAIKNTPPNGKIIMKLGKKRDWAEFTISDTGIGLTREEMDRLFTRFGKIERYGDGLEYIDIQGSGLGLYISKEILDLHEGHIWAESAGRDKGCTFTIKLPIK